MNDERQIPPKAVVDTQEDSTSTKGEDQPTLFSSIHMYALADKYDISPLKKLARQKFYSWAENNWTCENFSAIVREIFESTLKDNWDFQNIIIQFIAKYIDIFI